MSNHVIAWFFTLKSGSKAGRSWSFHRYSGREAGMTCSDVGRNKAIQARSARWRFRRIWGMFAGNASSRYRSNRLIPAYSGISRFHIDVGRNKTIQARSARWRFRRIWGCLPETPVLAIARTGLFRPTSSESCEAWELTKHQQGVH